MLGQGFYVGTVALLGATIGMIVRHTAGATALTAGLLFLTVMVLKGISDSTALSRWAPGVAAEGLDLDHAPRPSNGHRRASRRSSA